MTLPKFQAPCHQWQSFPPPTSQQTSQSPYQRRVKDTRAKRESNSLWAYLCFGPWPTSPRASCRTRARAPSNNRGRGDRRGCAPNTAGLQAKSCLTSLSTWMAIELHQKPARSTPCGCTVQDIPGAAATENMISALGYCNEPRAKQSQAAFQPLRPPSAQSSHRRVCL